MRQDGALSERQHIPAANNAGNLSAGACLPLPNCGKARRPHSCSGFESRYRNCPATHGGRRLQTCATGDWAQRSCSGFESRYRNCPATHGGRRLQTCATGERAQRSCSGFESRYRNCPTTHSGRRLQTCATGEWARRSCSGFESRYRNCLQHTAVAGYKPALPGNGHNALVGF